jgi:hypothetical protein
MIEMIEVLVGILSGIAGTISLLCFILLGILVLIAVLGVYAVSSLLWDLIKGGHICRNERKSHRT